MKGPDHIEIGEAQGIVGIEQAGVLVPDRNDTFRRRRLAHLLFVIQTHAVDTVAYPSRCQFDVWSPAKIGLHRQTDVWSESGSKYDRGMSIDFAECDRARLARDRAYDGRFYTGVHTTGIYCRPVCPVRPARSANVSFFPSAAAAELAGFRPCLRCRPETAPFSSAWIGSRATVERALRLIANEGVLDQDDASVESLAQRLGMGTRQLTRLFARHLQASPSKVARTARVQRAKRLLDETSLPMTEVAMQAGFGSLRRFNSVFAEVYGRPPTKIRRTQRSSRT